MRGNAQEIGITAFVSWGYLLYKYMCGNCAFPVCASGKKKNPARNKRHRGLLFLLGFAYADMTAIRSGIAKQRLIHETHNKMRFISPILCIIFYTEINVKKNLMWFLSKTTRYIIKYDEN